MASIVGFFKKLGSVFAHILHGIEKVVPDEQLIAGIEYVEHAAEAFVDNTERRQWVIAQLMNRFHVSESIARLITELAVFQVKKGIETGADAIKADIPPAA